MFPQAPATRSPQVRAVVTTETQRPSLTDRELVVLGLVVDGLTNPQIARRLTNSPRTVQSHVRSLMRKFGVTTRTELAVHALRRRYVPLDAVEPHEAGPPVAEAA